MKTNLKTIILSLTVMALWGSLFPMVKIGYSTLGINSDCVPDILMFASLRFLICGASGLASVAIPMAKAFGARVITSVLSDEIAEKIKPLGADIIINSTKEDVSEILKQEEINGNPVNMSMDCLCGETLGKSLSYMADGGYWVVISTLAGIETNILLRPLLTKSLHLVGSMLRKRSSEEKAAIINELVEKVWPKIEDGQIKINIYKTLPFEMANEAQDILERGENIGKVVLKINDVTAEIEKYE